MWSTHSSPSTTSSGRSASASATAPIRRRWHVAGRCRRSKANERSWKLSLAVVARIIGPAPTEDEIVKSGPVSAEVRTRQDFGETIPGGSLPKEQDNEKIAVAQDAPEKKPDQSSGCDESTLAQQVDFAMQHQSAKAQLLQSAAKPRHGRAL